MLLDKIAIHPDDINTAYESMAETMKNLGLKDCMENISENLPKRIGKTYPDELQTKLIHELYDMGKDIIEEQTAPYVCDIDIHENAHASSFTVNEDDAIVIKTCMLENDIPKRQKMFNLAQWLQNEDVPGKDISYILKDDILRDVLNELDEQKGYLIFYDSEAELGRDNDDNPLYKDYSSDEEFGLFLLNNFKNNHADLKDICFKAPSGTIYMAGL